MKVFELGYPFLVEGEEKLRWDSDGPVTQSMIAGILWVWAPKYRNGFCEVTFERMWASCFIG